MNFQVSKIMTTPGDERNLMFTNAEEEVFLPECDLVLTISEDGETSRAFSTLNQVPTLSQKKPGSNFHLNIWKKSDPNFDLYETSFEISFEHLIETRLKTLVKKKANNFELKETRLELSSEHLKEARFELWFKRNG